MASTGVLACTSRRTSPLLRIDRRGPRRSASSWSASRGRAAGRPHLMMHVVMVVMVVPPVMIVVVVMMHGRGRSGRSRRGRGGFLRPGVTRKADRESGRGDKTLDHWVDVLNQEDLFWSSRAPRCACSPELNMNSAVEVNSRDGWRKERSFDQVGAFAGARAAPSRRSPPLSRSESPLRPHT
jgi:hypothetical protein